jgi:hypothetical protein
LFSGDANERAVEQKKQAEVTFDATLEWRRALGARAAALRPAARVSVSICRLTDTRRAEPGRQQARAVAASYALNESAVETSEAGFVQRRDQFGRRAALSEATSNKECGKHARRESASELWLKHEHRASIGQLPIEEACEGGFCNGLWESGRQGVQASAGFDCREMPVFARTNARWTFEHTDSQLVTKPGKVSFRGVFGGQGGRRRPIRAGSHLGRECSMRLADGVRRILGLGGRSHVGGPFFRGSRSVVIPSSVDILCK